MIIQSEYNFGDIVYLKTDKNQDKYIVVAVQADPTGIVYELACGSNKSFHHSIEISREKDVLMAIS